MGPESYYDRTKESASSMAEKLMETLQPGVSCPSYKPTLTQSKPTQTNPLLGDVL